MGPGSEIGRELSAGELVVKTVVVVGREDQPHCAITAWVMEVEESSVTFLCQAINVTLTVVRHPQGTMADDTGMRIHVWEYLGEI